MGKLKAVVTFCAQVVIVLGALACILVWLKIEPKDIKAMTLSLPHWLWLAAGLIMFALGLASSWRQFNLALEVKRLQRELGVLSKRSMPEAAALPRNTKEARLLFEGANWLNLPAPMNQSYGYYFSVSNGQHKREITARDVEVSLRFEHVDGDKRESVGVWLENPSSGGMVWKKQISIGMGDLPKMLAVFYWGVNAEKRVYRLIDAKKMNINPYGLLLNLEDSEPLAFGEWKLSMKFTGENLAEEWDTTMQLSARGTPTYSPVVRRPLTLSYAEGEQVFAGRVVP